MAACSLSHEAQTPTSPGGLSSSISQWGEDVTKMNCGVCKVKFSRATNVDEKTCGSIWTSLVGGLAHHHLLSSVTVAKKN